MANSTRGPGVFFFDVPVYRIDREKYYAQREKSIKKDIEDTFVVSDIDIKFYKENPSRLEQIRDHLAERYGGCWEFNEIIGYVRLHFLGSQIRGEYFGISTRRYVKTRKKLFKYQTWKLAPEVSVERSVSSKEIFKAVEEYIEDCKRELPGRYFDTSVLKNIGKFIDWKSLMQSKP